MEFCLFDCAYVIDSLAKHRILFLCFLSHIPFIPLLLFHSCLPFLLHSIFRLSIRWE